MSSLNSSRPLSSLSSAHLDCVFTSGHSTAFVFWLKLEINTVNTHICKCNSEALKVRTALSLNSVWTWVHVALPGYSVEMCGPASSDTWCRFQQKTPPCPLRWLIRTSLETHTGADLHIKSLSGREDAYGLTCCHSFLHDFLFIIPIDDMPLCGVQFDVRSL